MKLVVWRVATSLANDVETDHELWSMISSLQYGASYGLGVDLLDLKACSDGESLMQIKILPHPPPH